MDFGDIAGPAFGVFLIATIGGLIRTLAAYEQAKPPLKGRVGILMTHPLSFSATGFTCAVAMSGTAIQCLVDQPEDWLWASALFLAFAAPSGFFGLMMLRQRHEITSDALLVSGWLGDRREMKWADVTSIDWEGMGLRITVEGGRVFKISKWMRGADAFAQAVRLHCPPSLISAPASDWLHDLPRAGTVQTGNPSSAI